MTHPENCRCPRCREHALELLLRDRPARPSYDPADFDPGSTHPRVEPKRCRQCGRVFVNRWVFLRHRPEGRAAITEPADPTVPCYSDRHLKERLGMRVADGVWSDAGSPSPLDEVPGAKRQGHGKGRTFTEGNRYGAHEQARRKHGRGARE